MDDATLLHRLCSRQSIRYSLQLPRDVLRWHCSFERGFACAVTGLLVISFLGTVTIVQGDMVYNHACSHQSTAYGYNPPIPQEMPF